MTDDGERPKYLAIRNWEKYQVIQHGNPAPWCKLHSKILDSYRYNHWTLTARGVVLGLLALRARTAGNLRNDLGWISRSIGCTSRQTQDVRRVVAELTSDGWLILTNQQRGYENSGVAPEQSRVDKRKRREREEPPKPPAPPALIYPPEFLRFWEEYPRKVGKGQALKVWNRLRPENGQFEAVITSVIEHRTKDYGWLKDDGAFIPHPATFLNQRRWEDVIVEAPKLANGGYNGTSRKRFLTRAEIEKASESVYQDDDRQVD